MRTALNALGAVVASVWISSGAVAQDRNAGLAAGAASPRPRAEVPSTPATRDAEEAMDDAFADLDKMSLAELLSIKIPEITTASQKKETLGEAPGTVVVVTENDIRMRGYSNLSDVLRDLPGMETNEYYSAEIGTLVPIRGVVGNNKIIVMVNGARINPPGGENMNLRRDLSVRHAKQIEIVYGSGSTMYGQDAISAVINIITKEPTGGQHFEGGVDGSFPMGGEGWLDYRGKIGDAGLSVYAQYARATLTDIPQFDSRRYELYRQLAEPFGDTAFRRFDEGLNVFAKLDLGSSSLQLFYRRSSQDSSEGLGPTFARLSDAVWTDSSLVLQATNTLRAHDVFQLDSRLLYSRFEIDPASLMVYTNDDRTGWYMHDRKYGLDNGASLEEMFTLRIPKTSWLQLVAIGGVVVKYLEVLPKMTISDHFNSNQDLLDQQSYVEYRLQPDSPVIRMPTAHRLSSLNAGAYLELTATVLDRLRVVGGFRADHDSRFSSVPISPRAALSFDITKYLTAKYTFSMAYVAPAAYFSYGTWENFRQISIPNPDLEPETSLSNEINLIFREKWLYASASAFINKNSNLILESDGLESPNIVKPTVWVGNDPSNLSTKPLTQSVNQGNALLYGGELFLRYTFLSFQGWASYSYVNQERDVGAVTSGLQQISQHNFRLGLTYVILPNLAATASFIGRSRPSNLVSMSSPSVDRYFLDETRFPWEIGLYVLYTPLPRFDLFVNVRNLTNNRYALRALYSEETGDAMVKEGITTFAGLRYAYEL